MICSDIFGEPFAFTLLFVFHKFTLVGFTDLQVKSKTSATDPKRNFSMAGMIQFVSQ